jgi:uncharacterized protein
MRVLNTALTIAAPYKRVDYDVLVAACMLHDIKTNPIKDHQLRSADEAGKILKSMKFSADMIEKIRHAIKNHNRAFSAKGIDKDNKLSIEAKILCDADRLDAVGAVGIVRMINFSNKQEVPLFISKNDKLDETLYGNMKYMIKIGGKMFTPQAKIIAWQRLGIMKAFNNNLKAESISRR